MTGTGTTTVAAGGTLAIGGFSTKVLTTRTLVNAGTATWSGTGNVSTGSAPPSAIPARSTCRAT